MIDQETLNKFDKLYNESYKNVLKYVICNCSNMEDVKDIVQNVYVDLLKKINKINIDNGNAYVMGIAKNKVNEYYRFNYKVKLVNLFSKDEEFDMTCNIPDDFDLQDEFIKKEDIKFIWNFLKGKKAIVFKVFYLYFYEDMSIKDVAELLKISESNVKHYLYRTLNELKVVMKNRGDENV